MEVVSIVPWYCIPIALVCGVFVGILLIALMEANDDED